MNNIGTNLGAIVGSLLGTFLGAYLLAYLASRIYEGGLVKREQAGMDTYTRKKVLIFRRWTYGILFVVFLLFNSGGHH
jgi:hypothetical protein